MVAIGVAETVEDLLVAWDKCKGWGNCKISGLGNKNKVDTPWKTWWRIHFASILLTDRWLTNNKSSRWQADRLVSSSGRHEFWIRTLNKCFDIHFFFSFCSRWEVHFVESLEPLQQELWIPRRVCPHEKLYPTKPRREAVLWCGNKNAHLLP